MRRPDWTDRMWSVISERQRYPFEWGGRGETNDCCLFAAKVLDAMHGTDWVADLRACYHDHASALAYIEAEGGVEASISRRFGLAQPGWKARRGDVVLIETGYGYGAGICVGHEIAAAGPEGVVYMPLALGLKSWSAD